MLTGQPDRGSSSAEVPSAPVTPHWVKVTDEALPEAKLRVRGSSEAEPRGKEELRRERDRGAEARELTEGRPCKQGLLHLRWCSQLMHREPFPTAILITRLCEVNAFDRSK